MQDNQFNIEERNHLSRDNTINKVSKEDIIFRSESPCDPWTHQVPLPEQKHLQFSETSKEAKKMPEPNCIGDKVREFGGQRPAQSQSSLEFEQSNNSTVSGAILDIVPFGDRTDVLSFTESIYQVLEFYNGPNKAEIDECLIQIAKEVEEASDTAKMQEFQRNLAESREEFGGRWRLKSESLHQNKRVKGIRDHFGLLRWRRGTERVEQYYLMVFLNQNFKQVRAFLIPMVYSGEEGQFQVNHNIIDFELSETSNSVTIKDDQSFIVGPKLCKINNKGLVTKC